MRKFVIFLGICFVTINLSAQKEANFDIAVVSKLVHLAKEHKLTDTTQCLTYLNELHKYASLHENAEALGLYFEIFGEMRSYFGLYNNAIHLYDKAIVHFILSNNEIRQADVLVDKGNAFLFLAEYEDANENYSNALNVFEKHQFYPGMSRALNNMGIIHKNFGEYEKALNCYSKTTEIYEIMGDSLSYAESNINIGNVYNLLGAYNQALSHYNDALQIARASNLKMAMATALLNAGVVHNKMSDYQKALDYYEECLLISKEIDNKVEQSKCMTNIATNYISMEEYDKAETWLNKGLTIKKELGDKRSISNCYNFMADIHYYKNNFEESVNLDQRAIDIKRGLHDTEGMTRSMVSMSRAYLSLNNYKTALSYADSAIYFATDLGALEHISNAYMNKKNALAGLGRFKEAYLASNAYHDYADSLYNDNKTRAITEIEYKYQSKVLEEENELLRLQSELDSLQIKKQKKFAYSILSASVMFLISLILLYIYLRKQKTYSQALEKKNQIIIKQNIKLDTYNRTKDKILSVISHDLRGTIGNQLTALSILSNEDFQSEEERVMVFSRLTNSARLSLGILENLSVWMKIQEEAIIYNPEQGYINQSVRDLSEMYAESISSKELNLQILLNEDVPCFYDSYIITIVLRNLLSNAIKFSNRGGDIVLGLKASNEEVKIYIKDQGIGIHRLEIAELLNGKVNKMKRGTENEKGSGLGLNIVKNLLDMHQTKLDILSEIEEGTEVSFVLKSRRPR